MSAKKNKIDIKEFYSLNVKSLWKGFNNEHLSFRFLCIYFLFEYVRPQTLYRAIDILPWAQLFLMLSLVLSFQDTTVKQYSKLNKTGSPLSKLFIVFCISLVISSVFSYYPLSSWEARNTMLSWVIVFYLVTKTVNSERRFLLFVFIYLLFNLKMAQHGAVAWTRRGFSFASYGLTGSPGWFRDSGEYAIQMLIYGSLAISLVVSIKDYLFGFKKWFMFAAAAAGYMSVMGASSRGSQLGLVVIMIWGVVKLKNGFKGVVILAVLSTVLYNILPDEQMQRFQEMGEDRNSLQRLAYWEEGVEVIKDNPIIGVGYYNWMPYLIDIYPEGIGVMQTIQLPHNIYIQAAAELGIVGFLLFLLMIIYAFVSGVRTRKIAKEIENNLLHNISLGLDAGLIGYLIAGTFVSVFYYPFFWIQISMIAALHLTVNDMGRKKNKISKLE